MAAVPSVKVRKSLPAVQKLGFRWRDVGARRARKLAISAFEEYEWALASEGVLVQCLDPKPQSFAPCDEC